MSEAVNEDNQSKIPIALMAIPQTIKSSLVYFQAKTTFLGRFRGSPAQEKRPSTSSSDLFDNSGQKAESASLSTRFAKIFCNPLSDAEYDFILKNKQEVVPHELMDCLLGLEICNDIEQKDTVLNISTNFPALVYTLGSENWQIIKGLHGKLANHFSPSVRSIIAGTLHQIAKVVGSEHTEQDLLPLFEYFLRDDAEVRLGLVKHLSEFYKVNSEEIQERINVQLSGFMELESHHNWRVRFELARECIKLCSQITPTQVNEYLSPLAMALANDSISEVRIIGMELLAEIMAIFIHDEVPISLAEKLLDDSRTSFLKSASYRRRQSYGYFMEKLLQKELLSIEQFMLLFEGDLVEIAQDEINFVRLTCCQIMHCIGQLELQKYEKAFEKLPALAFFDPDLEIQHQAKIILKAIDPSSDEINLAEWKKRVKEREDVMWEEFKEFRRQQFMDEFVDF